MPDYVLSVSTEEKPTLFSVEHTFFGLQVCKMNKHTSYIVQETSCFVNKDFLHPACTDCRQLMVHKNTAGFLFFKAKLPVTMKIYSMLQNIFQKLKR